MEASPLTPLDQGHCEKASGLSYVIPDADTGMQDRDLPILRTEWTGSSELFMDTNLKMQADGELDTAISRRAQAVRSIANDCYNPAAYIELSYADFSLGFHDIAAASAYKAILLLDSALGLDLQLQQPVLAPFRIKIQLAVINVLRTQEPNTIYVELLDAKRKAYRALLNALLGCSAFWDGLVQAQKALQMFPKDHDILELRSALKDGFRCRTNEYKEIGIEGQDLRVLTHWGKVHQVPYPWLDPALNMRTSALVELINKNFGAENCEIRPVVFGSALDPRVGTQDITASKTCADVGSLGVFAIRDIAAGEILLVDECVTGVSPMPPQMLEHCDACHATLKAPFQNPDDIVTPECCNQVAFCSKKCYLNASKSYHKLLCGKDFTWVYQEDKGLKFNHGTRWKAIMFLRIMAVVLSDTTISHPLQHPLVARLGANYSPPGTIPTETHFWQYFENVEAPTRILLQLGIDVFANQDFAAEVITTIYWRIENNANMSSIDLSSTFSDNSDGDIEDRARANFPQLTDKEYREMNQKGAFQMVCLNPQYVFFNHSCEPNVGWHGAIPDPSVDIAWLLGYNDQVHPVGSSTVFCRASRDVKKDEELKISYIGDPTGKGGRHEGKIMAPSLVREAKRDCLTKWFPNGCGCRICEAENRVEEEKKLAEIALDVTKQKLELEDKLMELSMS